MELRKTMSLGVPVWEGIRKTSLALLDAKKMDRLILLDIAALCPCVEIPHATIAASGLKPSSIKKFDYDQESVGQIGGGAGWPLL